MGFKTEFNWVLKLKPEQGLDEKNLRVGRIYDFLKEEHGAPRAEPVVPFVTPLWGDIRRSSSFVG